MRFMSVVALFVFVHAAPAPVRALQMDTWQRTSRQTVVPGVLSLQQSPSQIQLGVTYLGLFDFLRQDGRIASDPVRSQFEFAVNVDLELEMSQHVHGVVQLQSGTGGGVFGFQGPEVNVTDLNLVFDMELSGSLESVSLTVGSFDTPFGEQTAVLTNNADAFRNPFTPNSLFYSVFGGTVGTLNTLGVMGILETSKVDLTLAVTNGTDESAANDDGNFEFVMSLGTDFGVSGLRTSASFISVDDADASGSSGLGAELTGAMLDGKMDINDAVSAKGYFGRLRFGDGNALTEDDLSVWMAELSLRRDMWRAAARLSGWVPDDSDGSGSGMSSTLPNPGLAASIGGISPVIDQAIRRVQASVGRVISDDLVVKGELFFDDYRRLSTGQSTDLIGILISLNGRF